MKALLLVIATVAPGCLAGASTFGFGTTGPAPRHGISMPAPSSSSEAGAPGGRYAPGEDEHWFSDDDFLVSPSRYEGKPLTNLKVAKMTTPAAGGTKAEAQFLVSSGNELWTATYYRTRVAGPRDLAVGALAFCHTYSAYRTHTAGPEDKRDARNQPWAIAPITDASDAYKGRVAVGSLSCPIAAVRVPIR